MIHFLDIGANIGNTFDWYLLKTNEYDGWHIWCFEPSPRHLCALRSRCREIIEKNQHNYSITICGFALSNFTGRSKIYESADGLGDSLFQGGMDRPIEILCGVVDAAEFINKAIPKEDRIVLKIDVEGSEIQIIDSILRYPNIYTRIDKVLIEFHAMTEHEMMAGLQRLEEAKIPVEAWKL